MRKGYSTILLGDGAVGKSSICFQYTKKIFDEKHIQTLGLDFSVKDYKSTTDGKNYKMKIWDTAG